MCSERLIDAGPGRIRGDQTTMPINLRYGQQAVSRGFITQQRLKQVLAKQSQLAEQGKKVSVRMILEKAKLLNPEQLAEIDKDLNIKVIKKRPGESRKPAPSIQPAPVPEPEPDFPESHPTSFEGMDGDAPDATVFSPPPADMQDRIRREREKSEPPSGGGFMDDDSASPFGEDPFSGADMAPEPADTGPREVQPSESSADLSADDDSPFGEDPFGHEAEPEPASPSPSASESLHPESGGFDRDDASLDDDPFSEQPGPPSVEPAELNRMDSSPKLSSLQAESEGFGSPEDEELPSIDAGENAPGGELAPDGGADDGADFAAFGNDIRSPEELEASDSGTRPLGGRESTGAMDRTVFSPRPPEFGGPPSKEEPPNQGWGEDAPDSFGERPARDEVTMFSPPPPGVSRREKPQDSGRGRKGADDFGDVEIPSGRPIDDVPTAPASMEDDVHPIRRGVSTSSAHVSSSKKVPPQEFDDDVSDELPSDGPPTAPPSSPAGAKMPTSRRRPPATQPEVRKGDDDEADDGKKKGTRKRVMLVFVFLLLIVVAILVLPVALYDTVPQVRPLRDEPRAAPIYDYVEDIYNSVRDMVAPGESTTNDNVTPENEESDETEGTGDDETGADETGDDETGEDEQPGDDATGDDEGDSEPTDDGAVE